MSDRRVRSTAIIALLLTLLGAPAALGAGWAKVSCDDVPGIDQAALANAGDRVVAAWPSGLGSELATSTVVRGWAPTTTASLAGAGPITTVARGYSNVSARPALVAPPGGVRVVYGGVLAGQSRTCITPPISEGVPSENPQIPIANQFTGTMDALALPGGGVIVANMTNGDVRTFRDADPGAGVPIHQLLGGPGGVQPVARPGRHGARLARVVFERDRERRDPPDPARPDDGGARRAAVEGPAERVTGQQRVPPRAHLRGEPLPHRLRRADRAGRAPSHRRLGAGRGRPTDVGGGARLSLGLPLAAAYRADGRLWVAWYDLGNSKGFYAAKLGDARGAGGTVQKLGRPAGAAFTDARNLEAVIRGNDLVVAGTVLTTAPRASLWTTYVEDPATAIDDPRTITNGPVEVVAPKGIAITKLRRTKCVRVRVSATEPARVPLAIYSGRKSIRLFGQKVVVFRTAGKRTVRVRVPFRAKTFNARTNARIAVAVRKGATKRKGEPPAKVVTKPFRFF